MSEPIINLEINISPIDFEKYCLEILKSYAEKEKLQDFSIEHDIKIEADDGTYQIDVLAQFTALGSRFKVLCECKKYNHPVPREKVELLYSRLQSTGSQKGILMSVSGYQSGALQYAQKHGIALIQIYSKYWKFASMSALKPEMNYAELMFQNLYPPVFAQKWTGCEFVGEEIYPSQNMIQKIRRKANTMSY